MRNESEAGRALALYAGLVRRNCFLRLKNESDVEDVFQDVFLKYILYDRPFESDAHEKAWMIRVTVNVCKDLTKSFFRSKVRSIEDVREEPFHFREDERELIDAVLRLPPKYRDAIYLHYYEGYSAAEIGKMLKKGENTVYTWLSRARAELRKRLGGEWDG